MEKLLATEHALEKQVEQLKNKLAQAAVGQVEAQARSFGEVKVVAARLDGMDRPQMRALADALRNKWKSAVVVLAGAEDGNVSIISAVTKDLTAKVHAGKLASAVALAVGGKGGGRPDMAEAGGKNAAALDAALEAVYRDVEGKQLAGMPLVEVRGTRGSGCPRAQSFDALVVGAGPTGWRAGSSSSSAGEDGSDREGVRGEFDLSLSHQYVLLHDAGAARNRQHPDDEPE